MMVIFSVCKEKYKKYDSSAIYNLLRLVYFFQINFQDCVSEVLSSDGI